MSLEPVGFLIHQNTEIKKNEINHVKLNIYEAQEESKLENDMKSCCGLRFDKRVIFIFTKIAVSFVVMIFSICGLYLSDNCEETNLYSGMLSFILGHWLR